MIKHFCTVLFVLLSAQGVLAQYSGKTGRLANHGQVISQLMQQNRPENVAMKTTAGVWVQRVIAQSTRDNILASLSDSVNLRYAGTHGSTYDYNTMIYPYNYTYSTSPMFDYAGVFTKPQVLFDTCVHWTINPFAMPAFGLYEATFAGYDTNNNLTSFREIFVDSATNDNRSYANTFTTTNKIKAGYWFNLNAGVSDSAFKQFFAYNSSDKVVKDSVYELHLGVWRIAARTNYTYDGSGNLTQIDHYANETDTSFLLPLIQQSKYVNTYDASNRLASVYTSFFDGTALTPYVKDTFGYSGALTYHNSWKQYQMDAIHTTWWPQFYQSKNINAIGKPDTIYHRGWDSILNSWVPSSKDIMTYNSKNNPLVKQSYLYNWTAYSTSPDFTTRYYYDSFLDFTAVHSLAMAEGAMNIYPNPATNVVTISLPEANAGGRYLMSVVGINGRIVSRQSVRGDKDIALPVGDLAPGVYWVIMQGMDGNGSLYRKQFVKL